MIQALLAALLLLAPAATAQSLAYAGRPADRSPFKVGVGLGWFHCGVPADEAHPIKIAAQEATLVAGGGDVLYPGTSTDIRGDGVWIRVPSVGTIPFLWCEQRLAQSFIHVDPLGQWRSVVGWKVFLHDLEPGVWKVLSSNIVGMIGWEIVAEGGPVWIGTHLDTKKTPFDENETSGVSWPLAAGEKIDGPGNPYMLAWTNYPNVSVRYRKLLRGYSW